MENPVYCKSCKSTFDTKLGFCLECGDLMENDADETYNSLLDEMCREMGFDKREVTAG